MKVLILPISGGRFVTQLGSMKKLAEMGYRPEICLSASGGNISAYVAMAADWDPLEIMTISSRVRKEFFSRPWHPNSVISGITGFTKGSLYREGKGGQEFFKSLFNEHSVQDIEIWTGTYNSSKAQVRLFCNRSRERSLIDAGHINYNIYQCQPHVYCSGDLDMISSSILASASIPAIVPPTFIDIDGTRDSYIDGGIASASPLKILQQSLIEKGKDNGSLRMIYVSPIDLDSPPKKDNQQNIINEITRNIDEMLTSSTRFDRIFAYEILIALNRENLAITKCEGDNFDKSMLEMGDCSLVELYPKNGDIKVDLATFTREEVLDGLEEAYKSMNFRMWFF